MIQVGINYSGTVHVTGCAFVGPEDVAIVEEAAGLITAARKAGMYSKAVNATRNSYHPMVAHSNPGSTIGSTKTGPGSISGTTKQGAGSTAQGMIVPSMEELLMRLPLSMRVLDSAAAAGADDDFMGTSSTAASGVTAGGSRGRRAVAAPSVALMQRPCLTSSEAQWGPTAQEYYAIGEPARYSNVDPSCLLSC